MIVHNSSEKFKYNRLYFVKFSQATHGTANYFTFTNSFENQCEEVNEAHEILNSQIDEFEQREKS